MDDIKSKSQKKREAQALQKIGLKLVELSLEKLNKLPLSSSFKQVILDAKSISSHGAMKRQAQLIGKWMRTDEGAEIVAAYEKLLAEDNAQTSEFHETELWRRRLLEEGNEALSAFIDQYHPEDTQQLRHLIKKAAAEQAKEQSLGAAKALFRYLRKLVQQNNPDDDTQY